MTDEPISTTPDDPSTATETATSSEPTNPPELNAQTARLVLKRSGAETEFEFPVNPPATIGRFDASVGPIDVDLGGLPEAQYISRKHAKISLEDGVYRIHDLGSSNGTFILRSDFEKVEDAELTEGTEFALGNARFVFHLD